MGYYCNICQTCLHICLHIVAERFCILYKSSECCKLFLITGLKGIIFVVSFKVSNI